MRQKENTSEKEGKVEKTNGRKNMLKICLSSKWIFPQSLLLLSVLSPTLMDLLAFYLCIY